MVNYVGRNARIFYNGAAVAFGKGFSTTNSAAIDKDYSVDSRDPALLEAGDNTHKCTLKRLYDSTTKGAFLTLFLAGTKFMMVVDPKGTTPQTAPTETWSNCIITSVGRDAGATGAYLENIEIEAMSVTVSDT